MSSGRQRAKSGASPRRGATRHTPASATPRTVEKTSRRWPRPSKGLLNFLIVAGLLLGVLLNAERSWQFMQPYVNPPISKIRVLTELSTVKQQMVEQQLMPYGNGFFWSVDIAAIRYALEELPWIASAEVRRIWPDQLQVLVKEELPVARWGKTALLSTHGHLFTTLDAQVHAHLPQLRGPKDTQQRVMQQYLLFSQALRPLGYSIKKLEMRERGSWFVTTQTGLQVLFGRDHLVEKMRRFAVVYEKELKQQIDKIERVDLRYANGLAVAWRAPTESGATVVVTQ